MLTKTSIVDLLQQGASEEQLLCALAQLSPSGQQADQVRTLIEEIRRTADDGFDQLQPVGRESIDCCGTGGSGIGRFNTSTAVAFVLAAAGLPVVKFGNRAASSPSGSFDVLDCLGISVIKDAGRAQEVFEKTQLLFLYAPIVYPLLSKLSGARRAFGKPTLLNYVGPLLNPTRPSFRLLGVSNAHMQQVVANVLADDAKNVRSLIVRADCGVDEICDSCRTNVIAVSSGRQAATSIPEQLTAEAKKATADTDRRDYTPETNASRLVALFEKTDYDPTIRALVVTNAAAGLLAAARVESLADGKAIAADVIDSGAALDKLKLVRRVYE